MLQIFKDALTCGPPNVAIFFFVWLSFCSGAADLGFSLLWVIAGFGSVIARGKLQPWVFGTSGSWTKALLGILQAAETQKNIATISTSPRLNRLSIAQ